MPQIEKLQLGSNKQLWSLFYNLLENAFGNEMDSKSNTLAISHSPKGCTYERRAPRPHPTPCRPAFLKRGVN